MGTCVFGDRCQRSHKGDLKKANASYSHNEGSSDSYESPIDNGIARSDKRLVSEGQDEDVQENVQDSLLSGHVFDPVPSEVGEEYAESDVQDRGPSRDDILIPPSHINVDGEYADKEACIFFFEGTCGNGSDCDFSHSISKDTETASTLKRPNSSNHTFTRHFSFLIMLPIESPIAPKPSDSSRKKLCKLYRQGLCQLEKGCKFLHPQAQQTKSLIKAPDTSTDLSCRLDSPLDRSNGEEDDNTTLEAHVHEIEGDINDSAVHDESQDRMDQAPCSSDESHPNYDDEAYQEQLDNSPSNPSHRTDDVDHDVEETYTNHVEPVNRCLKPSKPASYYGDGWEERSSSPPPPPPATQLKARQRIALPVAPPPKYPHVSEIIPHWTQFADPHASKDVPFCKQLAQGGCSQGDRCCFRHSLTVEEYTLLFNDRQPNLWTLQRDGVNEAAVSSSTSSQPQVDSPHISSAAVARSSLFGQDCKFYPIGMCRNGNSCPYRHTTQHPTALAATVPNADQNWQTSERPAFGTRTQNSMRPCEFYFERGYCIRGILCKFSHGVHPDSNHLSSGPSGPESAPSLVDDDKGWSTGRENKVNNNNSDADTPAEDNGWGIATKWDEPSNVEDHSAWDSPSGNDHNHQPRPRKSNVCFQFAEGHCRRGEGCRYSHDQELSNKPLNSDAPKAEDGEWLTTEDSSHSAPWNTAPPAQCPYFLKGNCRNGSFCRMSHDSEEKPQEGSQSEEPYKAENSTNEPGEIAQNETLSTWETEREPKTLGENQPKAQEGDLHILDKEATWLQPWHTETVQPPPLPIKIDAPCKRFGQGYCRFGDDCTYLHITEDSDIVEHTSISEGDISVSISLNRCTLAI